MDDRFRNAAIGVPRQTAMEVAGKESERMSPTREAFEIQERALCGLHELVEELERRLEPVLASSQPQPAATEKAPKNDVMLVRTIDALTSRACSTRERVRGILERLAL